MYVFPSHLLEASLLTKLVASNYYPSVALRSDCILDTHTSEELGRQRHAWVRIPSHRHHWKMLIIPRCHIVPYSPP